MKSSGKVSMNLAPIVLFVYNRSECTLKTLEHLKQNVLADQSVLFIYSDGPKVDANDEDIQKIQKVREIILREKWCKEVHILESFVNHGLADSIINGVTEIVNRYGKIIVLEDDLVTSTHFLEYMNEGLSLYENSERVFQIVGYTAPIKTAFKNESFFLPIASTLGWGTWLRAWKYFEKVPHDYNTLRTDKKLRKKFDLDNSYPYSDTLILQIETNVDSWGILWWWSVFKHKGISLYPDRTLVAHTGFDQDATHTKKVIDDFNKYWIKDYHINKFPSHLRINRFMYFKLIKIFRKRTHKSIFRRILKKIVKNKFYDKS